MERARSFITAPEPKAKDKLGQIDGLVQPRIALTLRARSPCLVFTLLGARSGQSYLCSLDGKVSDCNLMLSVVELVISKHAESHKQ